MLRKHTKTAYLPLLILALFAVWMPVYAQFGIPSGVQPELRIKPEFPSPESTFTVSIANPPRDFNRATITWFADGTALSTSNNARTVELTAPELGTRMQVAAVVTPPNNAVVRIEKTVVSNDVDVVIEGETTAPQFYRGRHLPSAGSEMRAVAIPHIYDSAGMRISASALTFRWSIDNKVVLEGRGADVLTTTLPRIGTPFIRLAIENGSGNIVHEEAVSVAPQDPFVRFYRVNPLLGLQESALNSYLNLTADEVTVRAEPYFISRDIFTNVDYAWQLNQNTIDNPSSDPQLITLRRTDAGGEADVAFSIRNLNALLQNASGLFTVNFNEQ